MTHFRSGVVSPGALGMVVDSNAKAVSLVEVAVRAAVAPRRIVAATAAAVSFRRMCCCILFSFASARFDVLFHALPLAFVALPFALPFALLHVAACMRCFMCCCICCCLCCSVFLFYGFWSFVSFSFCSTFATSWASVCQWRSLCYSSLRGMNFRKNL